MRAWRASLCAKTARTSASVKTTGTRAGRFGALDVVGSFPPEDLLVEEHDSAKRLILGRSCYVSLDRKVGQRALDLGFAHGVRMALPMEQST
jgi:hypothetical protein